MYLYWWRKLGIPPPVLGVHLVCTCHQTTWVSLLCTYSQCPCYSLCLTGRKQNEIIVVFCLPITWAPGLWWLVCDYVRYLQQSSNWTNITCSSCLLCTNSLCLCLYSTYRIYSLILMWKTSLWSDVECT